MSLKPPHTTGVPLSRFAFYGIAIALALVHVFITFKGLRSPNGMEQAQLAREMARGNGFQTKVIRPYAWALLTEEGKPARPDAMPEISQPPLQPLLWAPAFSLLHGHAEYRPGKESSIYLYDRVIACFGVTGFLLTLFWTHGAARKLFDERVAGITVLGLLVCEPLWDLSVSGSPVGLLLPLTALAFRLLVSVVTRAHQGGSPRLPLLLLSAVAALMLLTHWLALWLALGFVLAAIIVLPGKKAAAAWVMVMPILAIIGWGGWMIKQCGDPLGGAKTLFQTHLLTLDASMLQRQFSLTMPGVNTGDLLRKLLQNWQAQAGDVYIHFGYAVLPLLFVAALLHRFRRPETSVAKLGLGIILLAVTAGMGFIGLPDRQLDDNQLYLVLAPSLGIFGTAILAVFWTRLYPNGGGLWARHGFVIVALGITALPMINTLPAQIKIGMTMRNRMPPQWPPYVPDRVSLVRRLVDPGEMVFSDAPWFVAWYADTPTAWIPSRRSDYDLMKAKAQENDISVAGFVMTPVSSRVEHLHDALSGPYQEWPDLLFRGLMLAFDREFPPRPDFEFKVPLPLVAVPVGPKENLSLQMTFYTDRQRTLKD